MLYELFGYRPHSSSDPFGATFPPGEGFGCSRRLVLLFYLIRHRRTTNGRPCSPKQQNPAPKWVRVFSFPLLDFRWELQTLKPSQQLHGQKMSADRKLPFSRYKMSTGRCIGLAVFQPRKGTMPAIDRPTYLFIQNIVL